MESPQRSEESTEIFQDLYDAIEKMEIESIPDSSTSTSKELAPNPTLGELLDMKITWAFRIHSNRVFY